MAKSKRQNKSGRYERYFIDLARVDDLIKGRVTRAEVEVFPK